MGELGEYRRMTSGPLAMLNVFCDESSDERKERVFAVGGVVGPEDAWQRLEEKWVARTGSIPFHANHCDSDQGIYAQTEHKDNKALYRDLTVLVAESGLGGWAFVIDLAAQRKVFPGAPDFAYYKCFLELLAAMRNLATFNNASVKFTFDSREDTEHNAGLLYGLFRAEDGEFERRALPEVSFASSRSQPRLQVADLFTREAMKTYDNRFGAGQKRREPRKSWLALRATGRFHIEAINQIWFDNLKTQMAGLQEQTGMSPGDYIEWLRQQNIHDNSTNQLRYVQSKAAVK